MPRAGFYNDNEYRAYPFVFKTEYAGAPQLPPETIVDCGFIAGLDSQYSADSHIAYLKSITRIDDVFEFLFELTAPGTTSLPITFTQEITTDEWQTIFGESEPNTATSFCAEEPAWEGFIVIGRLGALQELLPTDGVLSFYVPETMTETDFPDYVVEPARVQSLVRAYTRSINVANYERPKVPPPGEPSNNNSGDARTIHINAQCIKGDIKLKAGYNCAISQVDNTNTITVSASKRETSTDGGDEICQYGSELPLYEGHVPPEGSVLLSGGPACSDLITSINGIGGPNVTIAADVGIQIVSDGENSIKIDTSSSLIQQNCG